MNGNNLPNIEQAILAIAAAIANKSGEGYRAGLFTTGTSTGNQAITGLPFKPRAVIFLTSLNAAVAAAANAGMGVGFADADGNQQVVHFTVRNGHGGFSGVQGGCIYISTINSGGGSAGVNVAASLLSIDDAGDGTYGFTINKTTAAVSQSIAYLAME